MVCIKRVQSIEEGGLVASTHYRNSYGGNLRATSIIIDSHNFVALNIYTLLNCYIAAQHRTLYVVFMLHCTIPYIDF